jgi:hypothetical protein
MLISEKSTHIAATISFISVALIVLVHWNESSRVDMLLHLDTLSWFLANKTLIVIRNAVWLVEKQHIPIILVYLYLLNKCSKIIRLTWVKRNKCQMCHSCYLVQFQSIVIYLNHMMSSNRNDILKMFFRFHVFTLCYIYYCLFSLCWNLEWF